MKIAPPLATASADVLVVGDGIIGLSAALEIARRGLGVILLGERLPGAASLAAPGLLAPTLGEHPPAARASMLASLGMYAGFTIQLEEEACTPAGLVLGVLIEPFADEEALVRAIVPGDAEVVHRDRLRELEPSLDRAAGAILHRQGGSIDTRALVVALDAAVARRKGIRRVAARAVAVDGTRVGTSDGSWYDAGSVVIAAGAWAPAIAGLPRALPVTPLRGQVLAVRASRLRHPVLGTTGYLVPRGDLLLVGSTEERVGFDSLTTEDGITKLRRTLAMLLPRDADAPGTGRWAGLRPMTPDKLPMIGVEPEHPRLVYACGHSRNGILLAPLTARAVADLVGDGATSIDLSPFAPSRFS